MDNSSISIFSLDSINLDDFRLVGGKAANLGELISISMPVPPGFCVTTEAYSNFLEYNKLTETLDRELAGLEQNKSPREVSDKITEIIVKSQIPEDLKSEIHMAVKNLGESNTFAVRSSATSEDSAEVSFAGQLGTFLNIGGLEPLLIHIKKCWASLYSERAIEYRKINEISQYSLQMAVIVQKMIFSEKSGIMFTADPVSGNRNTIIIDAGFGLGEALVSGLISPDSFHVDKTKWEIIEARISEKTIGIFPQEHTDNSMKVSGVVKKNLPEHLKSAASLTDSQVIELAKIGQRIEEHYHKPQDIEWAYTENQCYITQARPITTLYPLPDVMDKNPHIYFSFNYIQVMTDSFKPLGISVIRMITTPNVKKRTDDNPGIVPAGGRLFVDLTGLILNKRMRKNLPNIIGYIGDSSLQRGLEQAIEKLNPELKHHRKKRYKLRHALPFVLPVVIKGLINVFFKNPRKSFTKAAAYLDSLVDFHTEQLNKPRENLQLLFKIEETLHLILLHRALKTAHIIFSGMFSFRFLSKMLKEKGLDQELNDLTRALSGNITTEMDMEVGNLADLLNEAEKTKDMTVFNQKFEQFLKKFGMRGMSEFDITRDRFVENPDTIRKMIEAARMNKISSSHISKHKKMAEQAEISAQRVISSFTGIKKLVVRRFIKVFRASMPFREHPKFAVIRILWVIKQKILKIGSELHRQGWINQQKDIYYLYLPEIQNILECSSEEMPDQMKQIKKLVEKRKNEFKGYQKLKSPKIMTNDGEIFNGAIPKSQIPSNALVGTGVSSGILEGIAHVVLDPTKEMLKAGEILVTRFTDPGWTPLFIHASGLVMEVGGLMTHGSVIAREYGIPAVVGVDNATEKIRTGQKIKIDGDSGLVELIDDDSGEIK